MSVIAPEAAESSLETVEDARPVETVVDARPEVDVTPDTKPSAKARRSAKAQAPVANDSVPVSIDKTRPVRFTLSGKVATILLTGQSEVAGQPGTLPLPDGFAGWVTKSKFAALADDLARAERVDKSKGYVLKVATTAKRGDQLIVLLEEIVAALTDVKGGGFDASNCRRYAIQAIDRVLAAQDAAKAA